MPLGWTYQRCCRVGLRIGFAVSAMSMFMSCSVTRVDLPLVSSSRVVFSDSMTVLTTLFHTKGFAGCIKMYSSDGSPSFFRFSFNLNTISCNLSYPACSIAKSMVLDSCELIVLVFSALGFW